MSSDNPLVNKAMMVRLKIGIYTGNKVDHTMTNKVLDSFGADSGTAKVIKSTLCDCAELGAIKRNAQHARNYSYSVTLPWDSKGDRMLPATMFKDHAENIAQYKENHFELLDKLCNKYQKIIEMAKQKLGSAFNPDDYLLESQLRERFYFDVSYYKIASPDGDFRLALTNEDKQRVVDSMREMHNRTIKAAHKELWQRCHEVTSKMADRLGKEPVGSKRDGKDKIFRDTMIGNIKELCEVLDQLNITNDPDLAMIGQEIRLRLGNQDPKELREDKEVRAKAAGDAEALTSQIEDKLKSLGV
jgi:hypothetical protein